MNYVNEQNMEEILKGIARKVGQGGGSGSGLEDWQAEKEYNYNDICVYEGQIYKAIVAFTSDTTFSTTQILEEYEPVGGETYTPYEQDTEITANDLVSYDGEYYTALVDFICGEEFGLYALEEYVPQELTEVQEQEIINHFMPNIYSGGNMSVEDSTPIGTIISFMGTIAPENYLVCDGTVYNIADYIELAEFINTQFGSYNYFGGDGITTFAVPDLQGEFLRMTGTNSHTNQGSGANVGVHQDGTVIPSILSRQNTGMFIMSNSGGDVLSYNGDFDIKTYDGTIKWNNASSSLANTGTITDSFTTRPTNTSVLYCIKYKMSITNAEEIKDLTVEDIKQIVAAYNPEIGETGTQFIVPNRAESHNALFRGDNITDYFNSGEMSEAIANGTFENIFPGDYIVKSVTVNGTTYDNVEWIVGDLDYYLHSGDTETTDHHVLLFPRDCIGTSYMNSSNTVTGGYVGSYMWTTRIPQYVTAIETTFGASHVLQYRELLSTATDSNRSRAYYGYTGAASAWAWQNVKVNLFNEYMIYGSNALDSSFFDCGDGNTQIAVMRHYKPIIHTRSNWYWLRSVSSSTYFAACLYDGYSSINNASSAGGVRPYFLLK